MDYQTKYKNRAFSLTEVIVVIGIFLLLFALSETAYLDFTSTNDLEIATGNIVKAMRQAQANSEQVNNDSSWGVKVATGTVTIFRGASYAARTTSADQTLNLPSKISESGLSEVVFARVTGWTTDTGTTTLSDRSSRIKNIYINEKGTIIY